MNENRTAGLGGDSPVIISALADTSWEAPTLKVMGAYHIKTLKSNREQLRETLGEKLIEK